MASPLMWQPEAAVSSRPSLPRQPEALVAYLPSLLQPEGAVALPPSARRPEEAFASLPSLPEPEVAVQLAAAAKPAVTRPSLPRKPSQEDQNVTLRCRC